MSALRPVDRRSSHAETPKDLTLHILPNFFVPTLAKYTSDASTIKTISLCKMFTSRGHRVVFYGVEESRDDVQCTAFVPVTSMSVYGSLPKDTADFTDPRYMSMGIETEIERDHAVDEFFAALIPLLSERYSEGDIVIHICDSIPIELYNNPSMIHVYAGHGGGWCPTPYIIYETTPWMKEHIVDPSLHGVKHKAFTAILPWVDQSQFDFEPEKKKKDTFLYLGRCLEIKGVSFFVELAEYHPDKKFLIAGGCVGYDEKTKILQIPDASDIDLSKIENVEYLGVADVNLRRKLLSEVTALIQPSFYFEPCGWNVLEALVSGTPVLTSNFGGFKQTVPHGRVGYRCNEDEWSMFLDQIDQISPHECREYALKTFNEDRAYEEYIQFFDLVTDMEKSQRRHANRYDNVDQKYAKSARRKDESSSDDNLVVVDDTIAPKIKLKSDGDKTTKKSQVRSPTNDRKDDRQSDV